jgi:O-antigen ligase
VLILSFIIWFVWSFCSRRLFYRFAAVEIGLCLFIIAGVAAGFAAADKRAAITASITLLAPILMVVLLVQILDSQSKIKLVLAVIAALGVVSAYQCKEQLSFWNDQDIKYYRENPQAVLAQQGIAPNSLAHWLFEHRLYSKGVHGFFTTSNSVGSFAILASFAAIVLFIDRFRNRASCTFGRLWLVTSGIAVVVVVSGLAVTRSKGAIAASLIAAAMLLVYVLFGNWLKAHKKVILIVCLLLGVAGGCALVQYGLTHSWLPGGNSMLVRWQYWQASVHLYADRPLTGVGPGNFVHFYPRYKPASALEAVADPHNFLLSILTQFGPLGLVGFLAMILVPLQRAVFSSPAHSLPPTRRSEPVFRTLAAAFLIIISAALLVIRPILLKIPPGGLPGERQAAAIVLYVMPVIIFIVGFFLLTAGRVSAATTGTNITVAALFCALIGVLIHNLIDFAVFEPGVLTTFWAIVACLIALDFNQKSRLQFAVKPAPFLKIVVAAAALVVIWVYFTYAFVPVAKAASKTEQALREPAYAHELLDQAAEDDRLDPAALKLNGRLYVQYYKQTRKRQPVLLKRAEECFLAAIVRNKADFKNFERLAEVYDLFAETSTLEKELDYLNQAFDNASCAVKRYPGSGRLHFQLAQIAEQLGRTGIAKEHYERAKRIEDSFRSQFRLMYPEEEMFSRLGEEKYQVAKQRIEDLSETSPP